MKKDDPYENMPWNSLDEWFGYVIKYWPIGGLELKRLVEKEKKQSTIPEPKIKPK